MGVLDGLRAIAVLIVMVSHAGLREIVPGGFGVTIFFFLSGYLITSLMVLEWNKTGNLDFRGFYLRRTVRIVPPMLICIAFTLFLAALNAQPIPINDEGLRWDFLFLTNYAAQLGTESRISIPLWSLNVEEHFYLIFPTVFLLSARVLSQRIFFAFIISVLIGVLLIRTATYVDPESRYYIYYWTHTRIDSIVFGCALALFNNPALPGRPFIGGQIKFLLLGTGLILFTILYRDPVFRETARYSIQGIGLFLIFNFLMRDTGILSAALQIKPLKTTADYSYVLYLIHVPLLKASETILTAQSIWLRYSVAIILSFCFAAVVHRFVEQPLMSWRKAYQNRLRAPSALMPKGVE